MSLGIETIVVTPGAVLRDFLGERRKALREELSWSKEPHLNLKLDAYAALSWALANMEVAYSGQLTTLIPKVSQAVQESLQQTRAIFEDIKKAEMDLLLSIPKRVQAFIDGLPLAGLPKLTRVEACPEQMNPQSKLYGCIVKFQGCFPLAEDGRYTPFLEFDGVKCPARTSKVGYLEYGHELKCAAQQPTYIEATLKVLSYSAFWRTYEIPFPVLLKTPPTNIGAIVVHTVYAANVGSRKKTCEKVFEPMSVSVAEHAIWKEWFCEIEAEKGWAIIPCSVEVSINEQASMGNYKINIVNFSEDRVKFKAGLSASQSHGNGLLSFSVKYTQASKELRCIREIKEFRSAFHWGETASLEINPSKKSDEIHYKRVTAVVLKTLSGADFHFTPGFLSREPKDLFTKPPGFFTLGQGPNPYLKIEQVEDNLVFSTQSP